MYCFWVSYKIIIGCEFPHSIPRGIGPPDEIWSQTFHLHGSNKFLHIKLLIILGKFSQFWIWIKVFLRIWLWLLSIKRWNYYFVWMFFQICSICFNFILVSKCDLFTDEKYSAFVVNSCVDYLNSQVKLYGIKYQCKNNFYFRLITSKHGNATIHLYFLHT